MPWTRATKDLAKPWEFSTWPVNLRSNQNDWLVKGFAVPLLVMKNQPSHHAAFNNLPHRMFPVAIIQGSDEAERGVVCCWLP